MGDRVRWGVLIGVAVAAILAPGASAATIDVNTTTDQQGATPGECALREAIQAANTNGPFGGCTGDTAGADTIRLEGGTTYNVTLDFSIEDGNVWSDLDINGPTTITTRSPGLASINGNGSDPQVTDRDRVLHVLSTAGSVTLQNLRIQNGWTQQSGSPGGGGILSDAPLTISNSEITGNRVQASGSTFGGGLYVRGPLGTLTMTGSTVAGNVAQSVGGSPNQTIGGGLAIYGGSPAASITNSTISGNSALGVAGQSPGYVGGAFMGDFVTPVPSVLDHVTITQNTASVGGAIVGGIQMLSGTMTGTIVAGNTADNLTQDCYGDPNQSGGGNVIGISDGSVDCGTPGPNTVIGTPASPVLANLGTLLNNGGPTRTHLPNPGSPAINRGGACPGTDQRGLFRYIALPCDAGSVEVGATAVPPPTPPATPSSTNKKRCKKKKGKKSARAAAKKCKKKKKG